MAKSIILIPSRMAATRLPNKPLLKINNKSMIMHVYDKALESNIGDVFVATSDQIISITDIFATCSQIIGVPLPDNAGEDSVSFLDCLFGKQVGPFREASVQQSGKKAFAIRKGKWKLIVHGDNKRELFDLNLDLGETNNIIRTHPQVAAELASLLQSYFNRGRSTPGKAQPLEYKISLDEIRFKKK